MNYLNEKLYNTTMKYNKKQEMLKFCDTIKSIEKINKLDELHNEIILSNLDNEIVSLLHEMIELKVENLELKGYSQAS